jgi:hypothetical protein
MPEYTVLDERFVFESGMTYLHVVQVGEPVDLADVICAKVPTHCQDFTLENSYQEGKTIIRHHLEMFYPYRGPVRVRSQVEAETLLRGVLWRRTDRSRMSALIQEAADLFWGNYDQAPALALVKRLPKNAPNRMTLGGTCQGAEISLLAAEWVPSGCIVVCEAGGLHG